VIVDERSLSSGFGYHSGTFPPGARSWLTALNRLLACFTVAVATMGGIILVWERRRRSRQALRSLDRREIRDFCLDSMETEREAGKPFWRP
jgi:uncharacterized protein YjiS (DUF1127 family)